MAERWSDTQLNILELLAGQLKITPHEDERYLHEIGWDDGIHRAIWIVAHYKPKE